jgi:2-oxoglutarate ferredoxin oxidoreductase subunit delta
MHQIRVYHELCKGVELCGICMAFCPAGVFEPSDVLTPRGARPPVPIWIERCTGCENCMLFCPDMAIVVIREKRAQQQPTEEEEP